MGTASVTVLAVCKIKVDLDKALNSAARSHDAHLCRQLIEGGANPAKVFYSDGGGGGGGKKKGWDQGNSSTRLLNAIASFDHKGGGGGAGAEEAFVDTMVALLQGGADADFEAETGNWKRTRTHPLFEKATDRIRGLQRHELKKRALLAFVDAGVELNKRTERGKQGGCGGFGHTSFPIFSMVRGASMSDLELIGAYLDAGVDPNCADSSWSVEFGDSDEEEDRGVDSVDKKNTTLLHAAIIDDNVELARLLVAKGADVDKNMCFTCSGEHFLISCLHLASEQGNAGMIELLANAGAGIEGDPEHRPSPGHYGEDPRPYEAGRWTEKREEEKRKKEEEAEEGE